jgi:hypothetical protein
MNLSGANIIEFKDLIHTKWFELQRSKRTNKGHAFLLKPLYDEIINLGQEALDTLIEIDPASRFIKPVQQALHQVRLKSWVAEDIGYIGPKPYYVMTQERGKTAITQDINRLANTIHNAGMSLLKEGEQYCGCSISPKIDDLRSINTGVLKYCQGSLPMEGIRKAFVHSPGNAVEHRPGTAAMHANTIRFTPTEEGYDISMEYIESGDQNWEDRQSGVIDFVEKMGGQCEVSDIHAMCTIKNTPEKKILDLALIISQLKDIDLLSYECIPLAFQLIEKQMQDLKKTEPVEEIWEQPWERAKFMEEVEDCNEEYRTREYEQRSRLTYEERLERDIRWLNIQMGWAIQHSQEDTCTRLPYTRLGANNNVRAILDSCGELKSETDRPYGWCFDIAIQREKEVKEAAKALVDRCPPVPIILGIEGSGYQSYELGLIESVCKMVDSKDCLDVIKQVEAREKAGIKPGMLELKFREEERAPT